MTPKRILIVEDDLVTQTLLREILEREGFNTNAVGDGPDALAHLQRSGLPELILIDLGLPTMHGFELCRRVKRMGDIPIMILTGDTSPQTATEGLHDYAEDYIRKPFDVDEVVARIKRVLSRLSGDGSSPLEIIDSALTIDFVNNRVIVDQTPVLLSPIETNLLYILYRNRGRLVSNEALMARVWGEDDLHESLRVHIHRLRKKLEGKTKRDYILTERGYGYLFAVEPAENEGHDYDE
ncbi:MAG TPA: response regulator transcription factor [Aggregatilineales bacterium]|nr:response regulator transcription factor [Anaerolineales bacterium]HRE46590.1 response regulator transcription factor [Aggregatilineales bacterium]